MTAWQELARRMQANGAAGGGADESDRDPWESAPVPAKVGKRLIEGLFRRPVPPERIEMLTNVMHWSYGTAWGAAFGLVQGTARRDPIAHGLLFGTGVWAMSYVQLVPMGLYKPPWKYPASELALDVSYHVVYGAALGAAYAALDGGRT